MAITRQKKETLLAKYVEEMENSSAFFLTEYKGLGVNDMTTLRQQLREVDGSFAVVKNTLAKKALESVGITGIDDLLQGPVGISFCHGDVPPVAKALVEFGKKAELVVLKGGILDRNAITTVSIKALAELPPLDVIRAQLLGTISAPATQLAGVVASGIRQVINVVNAYADSGEGDASAA